MDELATAILQYLVTTNKIGEKESLGRILIAGEDDLQVNITLKGGEKPEGRTVELPPPAAMEAWPQAGGPSTHAPGHVALGACQLGRVLRGQLCQSG